MADQANNSETMETVLKCRIITPQTMVFDGEINKVSAKGLGGEFEFYAGHEPTMSPLEISIMEVEMTTGQSKFFAIHGGFLNMDGQSVNILADAAEDPREINIERAKEAQIRAKERLDKVSGKAEDIEIDIDRAKLALLRATLRIQACEKFAEE